MTIKYLQPEGPFDFGETLLNLFSGLRSWHTDTIPSVQDENALLWEFKKAPLSDVIKGLPESPQVIVNYLHQPNRNYSLILRDNDTPMLVDVHNGLGEDINGNYSEISAVQSNVGFDVEPSDTDLLVAGMILFLLRSSKLSNEIKAMLVEGYNWAIRPMNEYVFMWSLVNHEPLARIFEAHAISDFIFDEQEAMNTIGGE